MCAALLCSARNILQWVDRSYRGSHSKKSIRSSPARRLPATCSTRTSMTNDIHRNHLHLEMISSQEGNLSKCSFWSFVVEVPKPNAFVLNKWRKASSSFHPHLDPSCARLSSSDAVLCRNDFRKSSLLDGFALNSDISRLRSLEYCRRGPLPFMPISTGPPPYPECTLDASCGC